MFRKKIEFYLNLIFDEDVVEEARFGGKSDPVTSGRVHHFGRALVEEGEDCVRVAILHEVILERGIQHLVKCQTFVHLGFSSLILSIAVQGFMHVTSC